MKKYQRCVLCPEIELTWFVHIYKTLHPITILVTIEAPKIPSMHKATSKLGEGGPLWQGVSLFRRRGQVVVFVSSFGIALCIKRLFGLGHTVRIGDRSHLRIRGFRSMSRYGRFSPFVTWGILHCWSSAQSWMLPT